MTPQSMARAERLLSSAEQLLRNTTTGPVLVEHTDLRLLTELAKVAVTAAKRKAKRQQVRKRTLIERARGKR